jgi:hypothetical protein
VVQTLWNCVNDGGGYLAMLPDTIRTLLDPEIEAWREREVDGKLVKFDRFSDFIITKPRAGCGWAPEKVEALLHNDPEVLEMWRDAITGKPDAITVPLCRCQRSTF